MGIHSNNINRGNKKPTKDSRVSSINSATCSSNIKFFKASISVMHSFSNNTKIWRPFSNNSSTCSLTILPLLVKTIRHCTDPRLRPQASSTTHLRRSWVCPRTVYCSHLSQVLYLVRPPLRVHIKHLHRLLCLEQLGILSSANRCVAFMTWASIYLESWNFIKKRGLLLSSGAQNCENEHTYEERQYSADGMLCSELLYTVLHVVFDNILVAAAHFGKKREFTGSLF